MSASMTGTMIRFTPLAGASAPANQAVLSIAQAEPQLSRTYYQDGRLLTAVDLNRDYTYLDQRLLDLGVALGDGIVQGLAATLTGGSTISVTQGRGIAPSGRVIAYADDDPGAMLSANLADTATQMTLNPAGFSGIGDGLYAVVLLHTQSPAGVAEVFPRDLSATRITYESIVDNVEIALIGLTQPIPAGTQFQSRAQLAAQFATGQNLPVLPSDSVALGVVAMQKGLPAWFDPALLRHALRPGDDPNAAQDDLTNAYVQIYADLVASLGGAGAVFRAADVFPILPPTGLLPSAAISPVSATQTFFPDQIDVVLMPARTDEIAALLAQAEGEPSVNLSSSMAAQILVLVPMAPASYASLAPALLGPAPNTAPQAFAPYPSITIPRIDPLVLRLPGRVVPPPSQPSVWAQIWALAPASLPWMVRPTDGGLSGATAAQLAAGYPIPVPPAPVVSPPPVTGSPIVLTPPPITLSLPPQTLPPPPPSSAVASSLPPSSAVASSPPPSSAVASSPPPSSAVASPPPPSSASAPPLSVTVPILSHPILTPVLSAILTVRTLPPIIETQKPS